mmetsp:Transcript_31840/g.74404  ORF Transcript_31840/g.74404 Transcript_31840/m.74404 type:complete len:91 (-) Transcript_31840:803-1075(-)
MYRSVCTANDLRAHMASPTVLTKARVMPLQVQVEIFRDPFNNPIASGSSTQWSQGQSHTPQGYARPAAAYRRKSTFAGPLECPHLSATPP